MEKGEAGIEAGREREELLIGKNGIFGPSLMTTGIKIPWDTCERMGKYLKGFVLAFYLLMSSPAAGYFVLRKSSSKDTGNRVFNTGRSQKQWSKLGMQKGKICRE